MRSKQNRREPGRPTPERLFKSQGCFDVADGRGGTGAITFWDRPLEKAARETKYRKPQITKRQYEAGAKFRHHWERSGMDSDLKSPELDRVFGGGMFSCGMPKNEGEAHHRAQIRRAYEKLGADGFKFVRDVVAYDLDLSVKGFEFGFRNEAQARAAAFGSFRTLLDMLGDTWGIFNTGA